ncbi:hypothetical protein KR51_00033540 [Rubidibacter lacunae KORDI 51-2]|uniref:Tetratricopeptide repeat protein n=1 Tax=Rubidibacter lacunae KORDI 51-2 TaxID=582515 RepID=U5D5Z5_9CHRO|nr:Sll0314/Alr1548 family TPR repeat-containing protein [Rubidibacter lacunae]ERN40073.1 hypothetical protein KR51_00033540 [Rubidibacter lacunae KORDI 51-2]
MTTIRSRMRALGYCSCPDNQFGRILWAGLACGVLWLTGITNAIADPFRTLNARAIGAQTEAAFAALFVDGDYTRAEELLVSAADTDPLTYALQGAIAYTAEDWDALLANSERTLQAAANLRDRDPLRADLYKAVGNLLAGAHALEREGTFAAVQHLPAVLDGFERARQRAPADPELNLMRGYLELLLASNLPLFEPAGAIARFERYAAPQYLVDRGIALAHRDRDAFAKAEIYAAAALRATPQNPEIHYLNAQILYNLGKEREDVRLVRQAIVHFERAAELANGLPEPIVEAIAREGRRARAYLHARTRARFAG